MDAISILNASGNGRPRISDQDRSADLDLRRAAELKEVLRVHTGHFPFAHDYNGDGRMAHELLQHGLSDGKLVWKLPIHEDHLDEINCGKIDRTAMLITWCRWEGFKIVDKQATSWARRQRHGQRISTGKYCPICAASRSAPPPTGQPGSIYLYDCKGKRDLAHGAVEQRQHHRAGQLAGRRHGADQLNGKSGTRMLDG